MRGRILDTLRNGRRSRTKAECQSDLVIPRVLQTPDALSGDVQGESHVFVCIDERHVNSAEEAPGGLPRDRITVLCKENVVLSATTDGFRRVMKKK